eukprot:CAMPEP_0196809030 /NCGR_PEP_ID=MMETSP1362-20130617/8994_1 /TAXON_ID=163516 /ORGANISM="Leptocylindrus danicus, Strain CCMP1856" /LENGTH=603 /DNA_ID=CAMNT_0042183573 /DNA_START=235 /DNA_END=2042 /DNA_ORIENTATION=+
MEQHPKHIVIIGAGASGLSAAKQILKISPQTQVTILEASDYVGGRIKSDFDFLLTKNNSSTDDNAAKSTIEQKHGIELGAEYIHGGDSVLDQLVMNERRHNKHWTTESIFITAQGDGGPDPHPTEDGMYGAYWLGKEGVLLPYDSSDADFVRLNAAFRSMEDDHDGYQETKMKDNKSNYPDVENLSLLDYLKRNHQIPDRMMGLAIAGYSNTAGCSDLNEISYAASRAYERHWNEHETEMDVRLNSRVTMSGVVDVLLRDIHVNAKNRVAVRLNARVTHVDYSSFSVHTQRTRNKVSNQENNSAPLVLITTSDGVAISADACIVSVPVSVLQDGDITFHPSLPQAKVEAFQMIGMRNAVKLILKFRTPLWPAHLQSVVCADSDIPEMWFRKFDYDTTTTVHVAVCYLMDQAADALVQRGQEEATKLAKLQLQRMFRITAEEMEVSFVDSTMYDWGAHDSIRGGYSFPKVGIRPLHFQDMADSVSDRLFFCGEHTHLGAPMTVQAAMETGVRAADEVLHSVILVTGSAVEYNEITGANAKTPSHDGGSAKAKVPLTRFTCYGSILRSAHAMVMDQSFARYTTTGAVLVFATLAITWSFSGGSSG